MPSNLKKIPHDVRTVIASFLDTQSLFQFATASKAHLQLTKREFQRRKKILRVALVQSNCYIACNHFDTLALGDGGKVYAWGDNSLGTLGLGHTNQCSTPQEVPAFKNKNIIAIASSYHSLALNKEGEVYSCGANVTGQLGLGHTHDCSTPQLITALTSKKIIAIATGSFHSLALDEEGKVYSWGANDIGQLGLGHTHNCSTPQLITSLKDKTIIAFASYSHHSLALDKKGVLYAWGCNGFGELGIGHMPQGNNNEHIFDFYRIYSSYTPPYYEYGPSSLPPLTSMSDHCSTPQVISALKGKTIVAFTVGTRHSLALDDNGRVYAWGAHGRGELGIESKTISVLPTPSVISSLKKKYIVAIAAGNRRSFFLDNEGTLYGCGDNDANALGLGFFELFNDDRVIRIPKTILKGKEIVNIIKENFVIDKKGTFYAWGSRSGLTFTQLLKGTPQRFRAFSLSSTEHTFDKQKSLKLYHKLAFFDQLSTTTSNSNLSPALHPNPIPVVQPEASEHTSLLSEQVNEANEETGCNFCKPS